MKTSPRVLAVFCLTVADGGSVTPRSRSAEWRESQSGRKKSKSRCAACRSPMRGAGERPLRPSNKDFTPLTDLRASAAYRRRVAGNLVVKALAEIAGVGSKSRGFLIAGCLPMPPSETRSSRRRCAMSTSRCRMTAAPSTCRAPPSISTIFRSRWGRFTLRSAARRWRAGHSPDRSERCAAVFPGVVAVITAARHSGKKRYFAGACRRAGVCARPRRFPWPAGFCSACDLAGCGAARGLRGKIEVDARDAQRFRRAGQSSRRARVAGLCLHQRRLRKDDRRRRRFARPERSTSAARNIFIWKARWRLPCPARTARSWSIPRPSIRAKCSTSSRACWRCRIRS